MVASASSPPLLLCVRRPLKRPLERPLKRRCFSDVVYRSAALSFPSVAMMSLSLSHSFEDRLSLPAPALFKSTASLTVTSPPRAKETAAHPAPCSLHLLSAALTFFLSLEKGARSWFTGPMVARGAVALGDSPQAPSAYSTRFRQLEEERARRLAAREKTLKKEEGKRGRHLRYQSARRHR